MLQPSRKRPTTRSCKNLDLKIPITYIGLDPGDRYAVGYTAVHPDGQIAFLNASKRSYYGQTSDFFVDYLQRSKSDAVNEAEAKSTSKRTIVEKQQLSKFYSSKPVLQKRANMKTLQLKWLQQQFAIFMKATGCGNVLKQEKWVAEGQGFIFVFGIGGGDFKGRGQPAINGIVQDFFVKSVRSILMLVASFRSHCCWD